MILSLISMFGGGIMRLLPELLTFLNKKTDNAHELAMLDRQFHLESTRAQSRMHEIEVRGDYMQALAALDVQAVALAGQMQKTGLKWVDTLNFLVRPLATYYILLMYGIAKVAAFTIAVSHGDIWMAALQVYDAEDRAILSGILAFWFVGRVYDSKK